MKRDERECTISLHILLHDIQWTKISNCFLKKKNTNLTRPPFVIVSRKFGFRHLVGRVVFSPSWDLPRIPRDFTIPKLGGTIF